MKSSILNLMGLVLVLSFAAACGKGGSSGGGSSNKNSNSVVVGNATGETAYKNLASWQAGTAEASLVGTHGYYLKDQPANFYQRAMCQQNTVVVDCVNPNGCFKHTTLGIQKGTVVMNNSTFLGATIKKYGDCDITTGGIQLYNKAGNSDLANAVAGTGKNLIKSLTQQSGGIFIVFYGSFSGSTTPTEYAVINTTIPSIMNPVEVGSINSFNGYKTASNKLLEFRLAQ